MSASMTAAALPQIAADVGLGPSAMQISFSIYLLGLGVGPFLIAALSEMYGRKPVWVAFNLFYVVWNSLCPVGYSKGLMIAGRFLSGYGAGVGGTLGAPILADMYRAHERGKSIAIAASLTYLGPALGPITGGLVSEKVSWPWLFWVLSIFDALIVVVGLFVIRETYAPVLLQRRDASRKVKVAVRDYREIFHKFRTNLWRPLHLLFTRPVIQYTSFLYALGFGMYCIPLSTFAVLYMERYGHTETTASLHYISIAAGVMLAAQGGGPLMDWIWRRLRARSPNSDPVPEFRVPYLAPAFAILPVAQIWYGWAAEQGRPWIVVDLGMVVFCCAQAMTWIGMQAYLLDEFGDLSASALASERLLSNGFGFAFPIFAPQLYERLGYGWGNTLLAFIFLVLGSPAPAVLWYWGKELRQLGKPSQ
jgi:MFS family permease